MFLYQALLPLKTTMPFGDIIYVGNTRIHKLLENRINTAIPYHTADTEQALVYGAINKLKPLEDNSKCSLKWKINNTRSTGRKSLSKPSKDIFHSNTLWHRAKSTRFWATRFYTQTLTLAVGLYPTNLALWASPMKQSYPLSVLQGFRKMDNPGSVTLNTETTSNPKIKVIPK